MGPALGRDFRLAVSPDVSPLLTRALGDAVADAFSHGEISQHVAAALCNRALVNAMVFGRDCAAGPSW